MGMLDFASRTRIRHLSGWLGELSFALGHSKIAVWSTKELDETYDDSSPSWPPSSKQSWDSSRATCRTLV